MSEVDLELAAAFNLSDTVVSLPSCADFQPLDKMFESADYGLEPVLSKEADSDLVEISIENGKVFRKYCSRS
jgi:hypothetical protein